MDFNCFAALFCCLVLCYSLENGGLFREDLYVNMILNLNYSLDYQMWTVNGKLVFQASK